MSTNSLSLESIRRLSQVAETQFNLMAEEAIQTVLQQGPTASTSPRVSLEGMDMVAQRLSQLTSKGPSLVKQGSQNRSSQLMKQVSQNESILAQFNDNNTVVATSKEQLFQGKQVGSKAIQSQNNLGQMVLKSPEEIKMGGPAWDERDPGEGLRPVKATSHRSHNPMVSPSNAGFSNQHRQLYTSNVATLDASGLAVPDAQNRMPGLGYLNVQGVSDRPESATKKLRLSQKVSFPPYPSQERQKSARGGDTQNLGKSATNTRTLHQAAQSSRKISYRCHHCGALGHGTDIDCIAHNLGCVYQAMNVSARQTSTKFRRTTGDSAQKQLNTSRSIMDPQKNIFTNSEYLEYLQKQLRTVEAERLEHKRRVLETEAQINVIRKEIYNLTAPDSLPSNRDYNCLETIIKTNKERKIRQRQLRIEFDKSTLAKEAENRRAAEQDNELIEDLLTERRMKILENIAKIRNRSELRRKQNQLADRMILALKHVNGL